MPALEFCWEFYNYVWYMETKHDNLVPHPDIKLSEMIDSNIPTITSQGSMSKGKRSQSANNSNPNKIARMSAGANDGAETPAKESALSNVLANEIRNLGFIVDGDDTDDEMEEDNLQPLNKVNAVEKYLCKVLIMECSHLIMLF